MFLIWKRELGQNSFLALTPSTTVFSLFTTKVRHYKNGATLLTSIDKDAIYGEQIRVYNTFGKQNFLNENSASQCVLLMLCSSKHFYILLWHIFDPFHHITLVCCKRLFYNGTRTVASALA